jgi:acetyltransferase-like isoleucine patch superfamily enzyme
MIQAIKPIAARVVNKLKYMAGEHVWRPLAVRIGSYLNDLPYYHPNPDRVTIGNNVRLANTLLNTRSGDIVLEDNVLFGHGCMLLAGTHDYRVRGASRHGAVPHVGKDIVIKNGTFIASGVIVLGPSVIGPNAVVCAGSVVRGDLPGGWICAGNPARPVREIGFSEP